MVAATAGAAPSLCGAQSCQLRPRGCAAPANHATWPRAGRPRASNPRRPCTCRPAGRCPRLRASRPTPAG
eukprot:6820076-Alexandrium_andersonii.AAC.1